MTTELLYSWLIHDALFGSTAAVVGIGVLNGDVDVNHGCVTDPSAGAACTALVAADVAVDVPAEFVARTFTRRVRETSAPTGTYPAAFAPVIAPHEPPDESQRVH